MTADDRSCDVLTEHQRWAVSALIAEPTKEAAARRAGISERTLRRWRALPAFAAEHRRQSREASERAVSDLLAAQGVAVSTLVEMCGSEVSAAVRTRAARALLEVGVRLADHELDARLDDLEREVRRWADQQQIVSGAWTG